MSSVAWHETNRRNKNGSSQAAVTPQHLAVFSSCTRNQAVQQARLLFGVSQAHEFKDLAELGCRSCLLLMLLAPSTNCGGLRAGTQAPLKASPVAYETLAALAGSKPLCCTLQSNIVHAETSTP